jgi:ribosomal protein L7/L12
MYYIPPEQAQQIRQTAQSGRMIDAIKQYRSLTNAGLQEAKDAVEAMMRGDYVNAPAPDPASLPADLSQDRQILELMAQGNKIEAIKRFRALTNAGLKEAKDAVEAMSRGEPVSIPMAQPASMAASASVDDQIRALLAKNQKIEAIKVYRLATQVGLKEAKDYVESIEVQARGSDFFSQYSAQPPAIGDDPFAAEDTRTRRMLVLVLLVVVIVAGLAFLFLRNGL